MIGLFDSGVGGLSVLRAIIQSGINEDFIYFGDTKNVPYGTKSKDEILSFTRDIMEFFIEKGAKSAVMACNTSSALVYEDLKNEFSSKIKIFPLIQSIGPYFKDEKGTIGVMATEGTVKSGAYGREILKYNKNVKTVEVPCQKFVEIVEKRLYNDNESVEYIKGRLEYLKEAGCKKVILGCTHFPYLVPVFSKFVPDFEFIDPAKYLVEALKGEIKDNGASRKTFSTFKFYVSSSPEDFKKSASLFFNIKEDVELAQFLKV